MSANQSTTRLLIPGWASVVAVVLTYIATLLLFRGTQVLTDQEIGHYQSLTAGILKGQTHLTVEPDPRLAALENPWAGHQGIPRLHDATYFNGRYYLYFGVTPVFLAYAPVKLLFGVYPTNSLVTAWFVALGFLGYAALWLRLAAASTQRLPSWLVHVGVWVLGAGAQTGILLCSEEFYCVPIASAYACSAWMLYFVFRAYQEAATGRTLGFAFAASTCAGLLLGSRPNWLFASCVLVVPVLSLLAARRRGETTGPSLGAMLAATLVPVCAAGAALAWYNAVRFGSPFEFGVHHQFAASDQRHIALWTTRVYAYHLFHYLFATPVLSLYYPFASFRETALGLLGWAPFSLLGLVALGASVVSALRRRWSVWSAAACLAGVVGVINLLALAGVAFQNERYSVDFIPPLTFAALCLVGLLARSLPKSGASLLLALMILNIGFSTVVAFKQLALERHFPGVVTALNRPAAMIERLLGRRFGPVDVEVSFPAGNPGAVEALLSTAHGRDVLYVRYGEAGTARIGFFHEGMPGPLSDPFPVRAGERRRLFVDLGGMYPPAKHPFFSLWQPEEVDQLRRRVWVKLDGQTLLARESSFYPSDAADLRVGTTEKHTITQANFSGLIRGVSWHPLPERLVPVETLQPGGIRLEVEFPGFRADLIEPLLTLGRVPSADLIYLHSVGPGKIRLGHATKNGVSRIESEILAVEAGKRYRVEVHIDALRETLPQGPFVSRLRILLDGETVIDSIRSFENLADGAMALGFDSVGAGLGQDTYSGFWLRYEAIPLVPAGSSETWAGGAAELRFTADASSIGRRQPLVQRGAPGAADCLGIYFLDTTKVVFFHDHWGASLVESQPVTVEAGAPLVCVVDSTLLHRASGQAGEKQLGRIRILLNGTLAWETAATFHPGGLETVVFGSNPFGFSTADAQLGNNGVELKPAGGQK
ncbi:hypothetical protein [Nibricoccus sp. IMCC34717]|uniref:hypothetical protein n=1 Tax=Nibricoccus sp. IMCC34717 TaxID=3034021 RepID=UPI003851237F